MKQSPVRTLFVALLSLSLFSSVVLAEGEAAADRSKRFAALQETLANYEKGLSWEGKRKDYRLALIRLKLENVRLIESSYMGGQYGGEMISAELDEAEKLSETLGAPLKDYSKPGKRVLAYLSPIDLSVEPVIVYVPTTYDGTKPFPLLVFLHGYDPFLDKLNWTETMYSPEMEELAEKNGFLVSMSYGRSNTEFMGVGETEVLNTLNFTRELFKVNDRRVVLSGASMGGSGTYTIACHHPDLFAGAFSITARIDYFMWMGVNKENLAPFKRIQGDLDYARDVLGNLLHVPVFLFHGAADRRPYPEVEQSRLMDQLLKEMGQSVQYKEFEGLAHQIWSESFSFPPLAPWLRARETPALPKTVKFKTHSLKYNRAYWLTILDFIEWGKPAALDATVEEGNRIVLKTDNIATLQLIPGKLIDDAKPVALTLNGKQMTVTMNRAEPFIVACEPKAAGAGNPKTPEICGPVRDAYCSRFLIVPGTSGTDEEKKIEMSRAQNAAREWVGFTQGIAHLKTDAQVTDDDIRDCNLILYGSPFTNSIVAKIAPDLPIKIERDDYVVADRRVPRAGKGLMMICPNPLNPNRYVVICDGRPWGRTLDINHKLDLVPDFIIYTQGVDTTGAAYEYLLGVCGINQYVCAGYFDKYWRLSKDVTWWNEKATPAEH